MDININDSKMNVNISNSNKDILLETNKIDMQLENPDLNILTKTENLDINLGISKIVTHEKDHRQLKNLDFESSGHTGFQKAGDYALKSDIPDVSEFATETYVDNEIAKFDFIKVVENLPETGLPNRIYFVPKNDTQTQDLFDEYVWVNNKWEWITTKQIEVDLTPYAKKEDIPDVSNFVEDEDYVHTDNNFTDEDKTKLDNCVDKKTYAQEIGDIQNLETEYKDNLVIALNGLQREMEHYDLSYAIGELAYLDTEDKSNLVNAINEVNAKAGIQEFTNQSINIYDLEPGIYLLSGQNTKLYRGTYAWWTNPVASATGKALLFFTRHEKYKEQGFLLNSYSGGPYVRITFFDGATKKEFNMMNLLTTNNSTSYTVSSSYQPAHKQYVDTAINNLRSEVGGVTDLGWIDLDDGYDGDVFMFMNTITGEGKYKFTDSYDDFVWLVEVETVGNRIGQRYWYQEEGFNFQYYRDGWYDEDADEYFWNDWTHYIDYNSADYMFSRKGHVHYDSYNTPNIRDFLNGNVIDYSVREYNIYQSSDKKLFYLRVFANNYYLNNTWNCMRYQEYYDIEEPSKIYKRTGVAKNTSSSANVTWGEWYVFEGTPE